MKTSTLARDLLRLHVDQQLSSESDDHISKWENMYVQGGVEKSVSSKYRNGMWNEATDDEWDTLFGSDGGSGLSSGASVVQFVTFDLDDTLWPTEPVIGAANDALAAYLEHENLAFDAKSIPVLMESIYKSRIAGNPSLPKSPVDLTELRKSALAQAFQIPMPYSPSDAPDQRVEACFAVWASARHSACAMHLVPGAAEAMLRLQEAGITIGAITNGNADVFQVAGLSDIFSFSVTSEAVGEAKPSCRPFAAAAEAVARQLAAKGNVGEAASLQSAVSEGKLGKHWVHIGDDFLKDVMPAKGLSMRAIWVSNDQDDDAQSGSDGADSDNDQPSFVLKNGVYSYSSIGSGDYLAKMVMSDMADAVVSTPTEAVEVVLQWHTEGLSSSMATRLRKSDEAPGHHSAAAELMATDRDIPPGAAIPVTSSSSKVTNFCSECGAMLPRLAKFCSECGTPQHVPLDV